MTKHFDCQFPEAFMSTLDLYILQKIVVLTIFQETNVAGNQEPSNVKITTHEVHIKIIMHNQEAVLQPCLRFQLALKLQKNTAPV